jgi:hypothetical protein
MTAVCSPAPCSIEAVSGAPKMLDRSNCATWSRLMAPIPSPCRANMLMPDRTWNSARKNGTWISIGRHAEKGLVPCSLYRAICSWAIAWRETASLFPWYFSCSFIRSGCRSRILRWAFTCWRNTGIRAARMTSTSPMMDRVHVQPLAAGKPMALSPSWKPTMIADTSHLNGTMISSRKPTRFPIPQMPQSYGETGSLSLDSCSGQPVKQESPRNLGGFRGLSL